MLLLSYYLYKFLDNVGSVKVTVNGNVKVKVMVRQCTASAKQ